MILGGYSTRPGGGGLFLPRIVQVGVSPTGVDRPVATAPLEFTVTIHEEGTALTYRQSVGLDRGVEVRLLRLVADLHQWSLGHGATPAAARKATSELGRTLFRTFLGRRGGAVLAGLHPTAVLLDVDETVLGLPWETLRSPASELALDVPFGRIVTTGVVPAARRDPTDEDPVVRILAVVNPTDDLSATEAELAVLAALEDDGLGATVALDVLQGASATRAGLRRALKGSAYDIVHFTGHSLFAAGGPHDSALQLADGPLRADDVARLAWSVPPYVVFNSSCESARAAQGRQLVSASGRSNGLAAAFLAAGCEAYLGHFWPVGDEAAARFSRAFYEALFTERNVGGAVRTARLAVRGLFEESADLTAFGAVFFGDAGSADRRDVATAEPPSEEHDGDDRPPAPGDRRDLATAV